MASNTENVKLGVCNVLFDGVDLGYTKGGVEVEVSTSTHEVLVDQFGETPVSELVTGRKVSAKVPLAETTLDNLLVIMPGAQLVSDGVKASGTVTFSTAAPVNGDKVTIAGTDFTFKTAPATIYEIAIPASVNAAATALAAAVNAAAIAFTAVAAAGVVTITAKTRGVAGNVTVAKTAATPANITAVSLTGGIDPTKAKVIVTTGVSINLISTAKQLVLRPRGTTGAEDFTIFRAACPGAMNFSYKLDTERVFMADFKGYARDDGSLFAVGDVTAV